MLLIFILLLGAFVLLLALLACKISPPLYARLVTPLVARAQGVRAQLVARYQAADGYLKFAAKSLVVAAFVFLLLPQVLRLFYPTAGGFDQGTINTLALAALQYFAAAHLALFTYKRLLPEFYHYLVQSLQDKVLENLTSALSEVLDNPETANTNLLPLLMERRKLLQFKFSIRCMRLAFCLLPLLFFFVSAQYALTAALTVVPR